jgi:hypothetical protein
MGSIAERLKVQVQRHAQVKAAAAAVSDQPRRRRRALQVERGLRLSGQPRSQQVEHGGRRRRGRRRSGIGRVLLFSGLSRQRGRGGPKQATEGRDLGAGGRSATASASASAGPSARPSAPRRATEGRSGRSSAAQRGSRRGRRGHELVGGAARKRRLADRVAARGARAIHHDEVERSGRGGRRLAVELAADFRARCGWSAVLLATVLVLARCRQPRLLGPARTQPAAFFGRRVTVVLGTGCCRSRS